MRLTTNQGTVAVQSRLLFKWLLWFVFLGCRRNEVARVYSQVPATVTTAFVHAEKLSHCTVSSCCFEYFQIEHEVIEVAEHEDSLVPQRSLGYGNRNLNM